MARLIVKSPYIKCGGEQSAGGYLKYIAMRERVEIIPDDRPPTNKQTQLIAKLVKDFPDAKELMEYEDYLSHPTKATASALITLTLESNWDRVQGMEGYAKYIALRPRAERLGEHGLFSDDATVDLAAVADELDHYTGNVWTLPSGRRSATARTEKLFSRSVFASFSMTKKGTSTFFVPAASSMAQVRRSTSGMVSSSVGSAMVRTVEK